MPRKPARVIVGPIRARPIRPPMTRGGAWYWRAEVHRDGSTRTVWSGRATRDQVGQRLAELLAAGRHLEAGQRARRKVRTVADVLRAWLYTIEHERVDLAERSRVAYRGSVRRLVPHVSDVRRDRADPRLLQRLRDRLLRAGYASRTVHNDLRVLRTAWTWAAALGVVEGSLPRLRVRVTPARNRYTPSDEEVAAVLDWLLARGVRWAHLAAWLLSRTGARPGEVAELRVEHLDARGRLTLNGKTGARVFPLPDDDAAELRRLASAVSSMAPGATLHGAAPETVRSRLRDWIARACTALELPVWTPYGLRRAAVDRLYRSGVDVAAAARLLGQSPAVALRAYRQVTESDLERAAERAQLGPRSNVRRLRAVGSEEDPRRDPHNRPAQPPEDPRHG